MASWIKISGTQTGEFNLGFDGAKLKNDGGNLAVKTATDSAHAAVTAANVVVTNDTTGFSVDITTSPAQLADYQFTLPPNAGVSGQFLQTAGNGTYTWEPAVLPGQGRRQHPAFRPRAEAPQRARSAEPRPADGPRPRLVRSRRQEVLRRFQVGSGSRRPAFGYQRSADRRVVLEVILQECHCP